MSSHKSRSRSSNSYLKQLLPRAHDIYQSFEYGFETRSFSLDIWKACDKAWYEAPPFKVNQNGSSGSLARILTEFFNRNTFIELMLKQEYHMVLF